MTKIAMLAVVAISALLYFVGLGDLSRGLAPEEVSQALYAHQLRISGFTDLQTHNFPAIPSVIYSFITSFAFSIFDYGIWQLRFTSALAGTISAVCLSLITIQLLTISVENASQSIQLKTTSFLATIIFIFSPWLIHFSRFASAHNLALALYLLSAVLLFKHILPCAHKRLVPSPIIILASVVLLILTYFTAPYFAAALLLNYILCLVSFRYHRFSAYLICIYLISLFYFLFSGKLAVYFSYYSLSSLFFGIDSQSLYRVRESGLLLTPLLPIFLFGLYHLATLQRVRAYLLGVLLGYPVFLTLISSDFLDYANSLVLLPYLSIITALGLARLTKILSTVTQFISYRRVIQGSANFSFFLFFTYSFTTFWHIYHQHYPLRSWPEWSTHWTKGAIHIAQAYPDAVFVVMEESPQAVAYLQFFDLVFDNNVSRTLTGLESAAELYPVIPNGAVVGIGGWRATPSNFQNTQTITLPDRQGSIIYKVGLWKK